MKRALAALALAGVVWAHPALAGKRMPDIDFGQLTCGEFLEEIATASDDDAAAVLLWIDGYLSGVSGDTMLRWRSFEAYTERLADYCVKYPRKNLLDSARKMGIER